MIKHPINCWRSIKQRFAPIPEPVMPKNDKIRVLHVVKWFYAGGAERLLSSLLQYSDTDKYEHIVLSLSDQNERLAQIEKRFNIPYRSIEIARNQYNILGYWKCFLFIRNMRPDVIKTWLPPSNIAGGWIGKLLRIPVIWGIHDAQPVEKQSVGAKRQINLSKILPKAIVCCSQVVYDMCRAAGYKKELLHTIPNGIDSDYFSFDSEGRMRVRRELGISDEVRLIGMAAECTPIKRHSYFLSAAKAYSDQYPNTHFILCGKYADQHNEALAHMIESLELKEHVHLLGIRDDMPAIYSAMDINTLVSKCESFGLSIAEGMACERLNVATDVGLMSDWLRDVGCVIPVCDDVQQLVGAWETLSRLTAPDQQRRTQSARQRIVNEYPISSASKLYDDMYRNMCR